MDICIVTHELPPQKAGGIAQWANGLGESFAKMGHSVTILARQKFGAKDFAGVKNPYYKIVPMSSRNWHAYYYYFTLYYLRKYLAEHKNAVVLCSTWETALAARTLKRFYPHFLMIGAHGVEITRYYHLEKPKDVYNMNLAMQAGDLVLPVSNFTRDCVLDLCNITPDKCFVMNSGINPNEFSAFSKEQKAEARKIFDIPNDRKVILTFARVVARKGHDTVINAMPEVLKHVPNAHYVVAGMGSETYKRELYKLADSLNIADRLQFIDYVPNEYKNHIYSASDCYVMVSHKPERMGDSEGFGLTFLEANASGLPVVGSNSGGIANAIEDGVSGTLVEPNDPAATANAIITYLSNEELSNNTARNGRNRIIEKLTWQKLAEQIWKEHEKRN